MDSPEPAESSSSTLLTTNGKKKHPRAQGTHPSSPVLAETISFKRVLPSRSRRGGPGVGNCDIDLIIIDAQRRAEENKPLIPPSTTLSLVTDSTLVPHLADVTDIANGKNVSGSMYESYFDRPEVARSFRDQELIETPVFTAIPDNAVGGRLRARTGDEEEHSDTSDGAYIARHRKYETFEKRQRRREKEKLVHEHHKLKSRIEQLRSMDAPAFGGKDIGESERRREAMLATATDLEQRYRALLPEPRHRIDKRGGTRPAASGSDDESSFQPNEKLTIKISRSSAAAAAASAAAHHPSSSARHHTENISRARKGRTSKVTVPSMTVDHNLELPQPLLQDSQTPPAESTLTPTADEIDAHAIENAADIDYLQLTDNHGEAILESHEREQSGESDGDPPFLPHAPSPSPFTDAPSVRSNRRSKKPRLTANQRLIPEISSRQLALEANSTSCSLLRQANRADPGSRKTKRTHDPLGTKLGPRVEEAFDYEIAMTQTLQLYRSQVKPLSV